MKKVYLAAVTILLFVSTYAQNSATPAFTSYVDNIRGQAVAGQNIMYVNTNASDQYLFKGNACGGPKVSIAWNNFDQSGSQAQCVLGFVKQKTPLWAFGNMKHTNGMYCLFASFDAGYTTATPVTQFGFTGSNAANMQISGADSIYVDTLEIWNNTNIPAQVNTVNIDFIGHLNLVDNKVVSRGDLRPYLNGLAGTPKHYFTFKASNGKIFRSIYGTNIGSPTGQPAHKMYVETSPGVFVDLNIDNTVGTYLNGIDEYQGFVYVGYSASSPAFPLTAGLIKININTLEVSGCGGGFGITPTQVISDGLGNIYISGSPKVSGPTGSVLLKYNIASATYTNLSTGLYTNQGSGSVVSSIAIPPACPTCLSVAGNMSTTGSGNTLSTIDNLARSCPLAALPIRLESFAVLANNNSAVINWKLELTDPGVTFDLQRSTNGINFSSVYTEVDQDGNKLLFQYKDQDLSEGSYYYKLGIIGPDRKILYSAVQKIIIHRAGGIKIFPNPVKKNTELQISSSKEIQSISLLTASGMLIRKVLVNNNTSYSFQMYSIEPGLYVIKVETIAGSIIQKIFVF